MGARIDDERICAALITSGSVPKAAESLGISPRTIYDRQREPQFRELYQASLNDLVRSAIVLMSGNLAHALEVVNDIMDNPEINAATRLQAAQTLINSTVKLGAMLGAGEEKQVHVGPGPDTLIVQDVI
jgi:hypothetical protein